MARRTQLTVLRTGLTYEKVIRDVDRRELRSAPVEKNWNNYIEIARGLLAVAEVSRMAVAEVAVRATMIRCGGDRQSVNYRNVQSKLTVKAFANSIGVKPPTLWLWIKIKTRVFDQLPPKERAKFKHDSAEKTFKLLGSKGTVDSAQTASVYKAIATRSPEERKADRAIRYLMSLRKVFRSYKKHLTPEQIQGIKFGLLEILKIIEEDAEKIKTD